MKILMVLGLIVLVGLLVTGVVLASSSIYKEPETRTVQDNICSDCGNGCTKEKNCGIETCAAKTSGSCGCNK